MNRLRVKMEPIPLNMKKQWIPPALISALSSPRESKIQLTWKQNPLWNQPQRTSGEEWENNDQDIRRFTLKYQEAFPKLRVPLQMPESSSQLYASVLMCQIYVQADLPVTIWIQKFLSLLQISDERRKRKSFYWTYWIVYSINAT